MEQWMWLKGSGTMDVEQWIWINVSGSMDMDQQSRHD
jgi:hypothetical protein